MSIHSEQDRFQQYFDLSPAGIFVTGNKGDYVDVNQAACDLTGYPREELLQMNLEDLADPDHVNEVRSGFSRLATANHLVQDAVCRKKDGSPLILQIHATRLSAEYLIGFCIDITLQARAEEAFIESEERYKRLVENSPAAIMIHVEGIVQYANAQAVNMLNAKSAGDLVGEHILKFVHPDYRRVVARRIDSVLGGERVAKIEEKLVRVDGSIFYGEVSSSAVNYLGRQAVQVLAQDISEKKEQERKILQMAYFDPLTGLANRSNIIDTTQKVIERAVADNKKAALLFIDLDDFKKVNDLLGHYGGDSLLRQFGQRLSSGLPASIIVGRYGGDEFIIIIPSFEEQSEVEEAVSLINRVLEPRFKLGSIDFNIRPSIGIAVTPDDGTDADTLLKNADFALYQAKRGGKNTPRCFDSELRELNRRRISIERALEKAIENDEVYLEFQPQYSLRKKKITGAEALLRWKSADLGHVETLDFIGAAEENGLIFPLTDWVIAEVGSFLEDQRLPENEFKVSLNFSPRQFVTSELIERAISSIQKNCPQTDRLCIEITESTLLNDLPLTGSYLWQLKEQGVLIAMDDFGTGYSSLSYLKKFPVDIVKIDKSFVQDVLVDQEDTVLVNGILAMSHGLGLFTVAEGVENRSQFNFFNNSSCDTIQGYFISRPLKRDAFFDFLTKESFV